MKIILNIFIKSNYLIQTKCKMEEYLLKISANPNLILYYINKKVNTVII